MGSQKSIMDSKKSTIELNIILFFDELLTICAKLDILQRNILK